MEKYETFLYKDSDFEFGVRLDKKNNTIWLNQKEICELFMITRSTTSYHLSKIEKQFRNETSSSFETFEITPGKKRVILYDLNIIIELGKRGKSPRLQPFLEMVNKHLIHSNIVELGEENIIYDNSVLKIAVSISPKEETVWLSQAQIASLFNTTRSNVTKRIQNIFDEGELAFSVSENFSHTKIFSSLNIGLESHI